MNKNNLICDLETGICGVSGDSPFEIINFNEPKKKVTLYYFTDPICSHCWALEPTLNKFVTQYGQYFEMKTVMGGLLKKWDGFADRANGIGGPEDVAGHWREVGEFSRMPIDGSLFFTDPVQSSFPPSWVYKVIQQEDSNLALEYLRRAREAVFAFNLNISSDDVLIDIVNKTGLDGEQIVKEAKSEVGQTLLNEDFKTAASFGVRGFPTVIMVNEENKGAKIVGARPYDYYVKGLEQVLETEKPEAKPVPSLKERLKESKLLFSKEIEVMYELEQSEALDFISKNLSENDYEQKAILGEMYIEVKK